MRLSQIVASLRSPAQVRQAGLTVGETVENGTVRIHRFRPSIKIWDLTNAGKRGKQVRVLDVYDLDMLRGTALSYVDDLYDILERLKTYDAVKDEVLSTAELIKAAGGELKFQEGAERGVDVAPAGMKPVEIFGKGVYLKADYNTFFVRNNDDQFNLPTCIPGIHGGKKDIKVFYRWVLDNESRIKNMTYAEVLKEMDKLGIQSHHYCAMD